MEKYFKNIPNNIFKNTKDMKNITKYIFFKCRKKCFIKMSPKFQKYFKKNFTNISKKCLKIFQNDDLIYFKKMFKNI